jgi:hypothetical protein
MKRSIALLLFLSIFCLIRSNAQVWDVTNTKLIYHPYDESYLKYCQLALKVELKEVFLNGGMCGHKIFKVKEVLKGEYPYPYVWFFICNPMETRDYVKELVILSNGEMLDTFQFKDLCGLEDTVSVAQITGLLYVQDTNKIQVPDPQKITPIQFLQFLKNPYFTCAIIDYSKRLNNWIKDEHLKELIALLKSKDPAIPVYESYNCDCQQYTSSVGTEALFLLEGYREGFYPPDRCSLGPYTLKHSEHKNNIEQRKKNIISWLKSQGKYPTK